MMPCSSERLIAALPGTRAAVLGWLAQCPCHGHSVALVVREGAGGRTNVRCADGCSVDSILAAAGVADPFREFGELGENEGIGLMPRTLAEILDDPSVQNKLDIVLPHLAWACRVTLLAAREKIGKSTLASAGASSLSRGSEFLGTACAAGDVLWLALEEHPSDYCSRFTHFGADPNRVTLVDQEIGPLQNLDLLAKRALPRLIVIDTLATLVSGIVEDASSATAWTVVMSQLAHTARTTNAAILLLHHARKSDGQYRDSTAIGAGVDAILDMKEDGEGMRRKISGKARFPLETIQIELREGQYQLMGAKPSMESQIRTFIRENPGATLRQVRSEIPGRGETIDSELAALLNSGLVVDRGSSALRSFFPGHGC